MPIRHATQNDVTSIAEFQVAMAKETENKTLDPNIVTPAVQAVFDDPNKGFYVVSEENGIVEASLLITFEWSDWRNSNMWYIQSVYVRPEQRGKGLFKNLYHHVVNLAREQDVMFIRLYVETENTRAQNVYEKLGMKRMPYYMYDVRVSDAD